MTHVLPLLRPAAGATPSAAHATLNGIDYLEVHRPRPAERDPLRQRTLLAALPQADRGELDARQPAHRPAASASATSRSSGPSRLADAAELDGRARPRCIVAALADADRVARRAHRLGRRLLDATRCALVRSAAGRPRRPPASIRARRDRVLVQGRVPDATSTAAAHAAARRSRAERRRSTTSPRTTRSFRRLMLDRMALLMPDWRERSAADLGVDAGRAARLRRRPPQLPPGRGRHRGLPRHRAPARLGAPPRAARRLRDARRLQRARLGAPRGRAPTPSLAAARRHAVPHARAPACRRRASRRGSPRAADAPMRRGPRSFEPLHDRSTLLRRRTTSCRFYTWGDDRCCLPRARRARRCAAHHADLAAGRRAGASRRCMGPRTGDAGDADPAHRHVVRLTDVRRTERTDRSADRSARRRADHRDRVGRGGRAAVPALHLVASPTSARRALVDDVSVARGNVVLVDHGRTVDARGARHSARRRACSRAPTPASDRCEPRRAVAGAARASARSSRDGPAHAGRAGATRSSPARSGACRSIDAPATRCAGASTTCCRHRARHARARRERWTPRRDLLNSDGDARRLRGRGRGRRHGRAALRRRPQRPRPDAGTAFTADYRVGNGTAGNVGADSIAHVGRPLDGARSSRCATRCRRAAASSRNRSRGAPPRAAGVPHARSAPSRRPTTPRSRERHAGVAARRRHAALDRQLAHRVRHRRPRRRRAADRRRSSAIAARHLDRYRMAGPRPRVRRPALRARSRSRCTSASKPDHFRSDVQAAPARRALSNRVLPDGRRGLFHPDNFSFGQTVYLCRSSPRRTRCRASRRREVDVSSARASDDDARARRRAARRSGRLEIARLDNDPNFPERGVLRVECRRQVSDDDAAELDGDCGCCAGTDVETPARAATRPGCRRSPTASARHAEFKAALLARLSSADFPALAGLRTRDDDDFTIALFDALRRRWPTC